MARPHTTLFMLSSLDGKISTGATDDRDVDADFPKIPGLTEGLGQYYEIEKTTDIFSLNTGRVMAKIGLNDPARAVTPVPVKFVIVDSAPHLTEAGVKNMLRWGTEVFLVSKNPAHPAAEIRDPRLHFWAFPGAIDFEKVFADLAENHGCERLTIQSGGTLNAHFLRSGLIDEISLVVAPALVGGRETATLIDGPSLATEADLGQIRALELLSVEKLENSYLHLRYRVKNPASAG